MVGDAEVFLTGGAGPVVAQLMGTAARYVPHLTLAGIALAEAALARVVSHERSPASPPSAESNWSTPPSPRSRRPDDVLLQIDRVGICGSDVHYYLEGRIGNQILQYPATLGHECSGTVLETGSAVQGLKAGDRVAVDPAFPCGACDQCLSGRAHTCRRLLFMGSPGQAPGAAAERYVAPAACCAAIPASMSLDEAMLVEPLSIGLHAVRLSQLAAGMKIAILGAGPIGLSVLLCAKATAPCTALGDRSLGRTSCGRPAVRGRRRLERPAERRRRGDRPSRAAGAGPGLRVFRRSGLRRAGPIAPAARRRLDDGRHTAGRCRGVRSASHAPVRVAFPGRAPAE